MFLTIQPMTDDTPSEIMQAHQYLYYVLAEPVLSDHQYDQFCKANSLNGSGGSDCECDYSERIKQIAGKLKTTND